MAHECIEHPLEGRAQRLDSKLVHMEAHFRLIHLQQVLEELAQTHDGLWRIGNSLQLAPVLAVHGPEDEVHFLLDVADVAQGGTEA